MDTSAVFTDDNWLQMRRFLHFGNDRETLPRRHVNHSYEKVVRDGVFGKSRA